jgi:hypothetical protein
VLSFAIAEFAELEVWVSTLLVAIAFSGVHFGGGDILTVKFCLVVG